MVEMAMKLEENVYTYYAPDTLVFSNFLLFPSFLSIVALAQVEVSQLNLPLPISGRSPARL